MNDLNVEIKSFEDFLAEDAKAISDANHRAKNGDCVADKVVEPSEHKLDKKGIKTEDPRHAAANKEQGDGKTPTKLQEDVEGDQKVGDKKDKLVSDDDEDEGDEKKSDEEE